ncbi:MAG: sigma-70 family RNA polymerase sigma factor [Phycisphaerales bacterium]|nr:sigma-70 family RNA polymerase sigma factor [Phycisphaerales bacterium]
MNEKVTLLLERAAAGSDSAAGELLELVYEELRRLAGGMFRDQRPGGTLQPTALVHEAYIKLVGQDIAWSSRAQFFVVATQAMRSILVDHARSRHRAKRGGGWQRVTLEAVDATPAMQDGVDIESIDQALAALAQLDPRKARLVELRFFGGLTSEEAAEVLDISRSTAAEEWRVARAWLYQRLEAAAS